MTAVADDPRLELPYYYTFVPRPDQPDRYDQQTAFYNSRTNGVAWLIGGNGAGTTEVSLAKVARFLLETPPPRHDTPFWIISASYEMVCKACWKEKLNPRGGHGHIPEEEVDWERIRWYKPNQGWPFEVPLKPHPDRPGKNWSISFKSYKQGRSQLQAEAIGGFLFVEQFEWGLLEEVLRGCREYSFPGSKLCEFTPIDPNLSIEIEDMIDNDRLPPGWEVYRANTECAMEAGHVSREWFGQFFGMVSDEMRETRMTGKFASYEGAVYKNFNPLVHLVDGTAPNCPIDLATPNIHHRRMIDWGAGPENAFVCLWAYRTGSGVWHVYDEYYSTDQTMTTVDHLAVVSDRWPWPMHNPHYGTTWADPSEPDYFRMAAKLPLLSPGHEPIAISRAMNSVLPGIEHVQWLLKIDPALATDECPKGRPRLLIDKTACPHLARQMRTYRWLRSSEIGINPQDAKRQPLKKEDHAVDALRYGVYSEAMLTGAVPEAKKREDRSASHGVMLKGRR